MVIISPSTTSSSLLQLKLKPQCQFHTNLHHYLSLSSTARVSTTGTNGVLSIRSYMDNSKSPTNIVSKIIGSLPIIGLVARILSDEGGVGNDIVDFAEFRRRVGKKCTVMDSRAFYEFQERRGKPGEPLYVLLCCWLAAVGVGLLKSEELLEGVTRLRISNDIEFEEETFLAIMNEAQERRSRMKVKAADITMELRAEKALEAIYVCSFGNDPIEEEDQRLLRVMLHAVFPTVQQSEVDRIVSEKAKKVAEGGDDDRYSDLKPLSKEAVEQQMKDLRFLQQNNSEN